MKLASFNDGSRDGQLIVVDSLLQTAVKVPHIAKTLQAALDVWHDVQPALQEISDTLNQGLSKEAFRFDPTAVTSPLPRAYQWIDGSAYVNHVELVRKARGALMPENFWHDPLMYQGGSDSFLAPCADIAMACSDWGIDFEAEVAVIVDDVPMGVTPEAAAKHIQLILLVNDVSLRNLIPAELEKGFGFFQSKPSSAFSPVAVTPDALGTAWKNNQLHLPLYCYLNEQLFGYPNAGVDMTFNFAVLIAHAAKTRPLSAGTILGSGTVSNVDRSLGSCCIAEKRMLETLAEGKPKTPFMQFGDTIRIEMFDANQQNIFGSIQQQVVKYDGSANI